MRSLVLLSLTVALWPALAHSQTWTGSVRDIRTSAPLPDSRVCAGIAGRVDLACTTSKGDGTFSVTYPNNSIPGADKLFYLYVEAPTGKPYFNQKRARLVPGDATCLLVPTTVYFRGRAVRADNGAPISGVSVALRQPGRIDHSLDSDSAGEFTFKPVTAYVNPRLQHNTFGVPKEDLPPTDDGELVNAVWGVSAPYGKGSDLYAAVEPQTTADKKFNPELPFLSSASPDAYTWVELRLPPAGTKIDDPSKYISSQIGPPKAQPDGGPSPADGGTSTADRGSADGATAPQDGKSGGCSVQPSGRELTPYGWVLGLLLLSGVMLRRASNKASRARR